MKAEHVFTYVEEDGYHLTRGNHGFMVHGTAEATYSYCFVKGKDTLANGDPGYPDETTINQEDFDCWLDYVEDENGNTVTLTITDEEWHSFESYMSGKLDELANEYDDWGADEEDEAIARAEREEEER